MDFDLKTLRSALEQLEVERGIPREKIIETIELALAAAYKKDYGERGQIVRAKFSEKTGGVEFSQIKIVVDDSMIKSEEEIERELREKTGHAEIAEATAVQRPENIEDAEEDTDAIRKVRFNPERHIMIAEARKIKNDVKPGEEMVFPLEAHHDYGRIAAQTAKQVIIQRMREAERESIFSEFAQKEGDIISGLVQRIEERVVFLDLGRATAILPTEEQIHGERYRIGDRVKGYLYSVEQTPKGVTLFVSRSHPRFVSKLFAIEVPEITSGIVEVKSIAREAGSRTKIAVASNDENIDPVGSSVGQKGVRVSTVIAELGGEKIDIIEWSDDPATFISHALSPARVLDVETYGARHEAHVIVAEDQLSLAIGRGGQNVRLAARLTGWKIDIRSRAGKSVMQATEKGEVVEGVALAEVADEANTAHTTEEISAKDAQTTEQGTAGEENTEHAKTEQ